VSAAQSAFVNTIVSRLPSTAPNVLPTQVVVTGATDIRRVFASDDIPGILLAYMDGLKVVFAIGIAGTGMAFLVGLGSRWKKLSLQHTKQTSGITA
jgi:MFS transporter, DHA2 family, glioxin efflux transporter